MALMGHSTAGRCTRHIHMWNCLPSAGQLLSLNNGFQTAT